MVSNLDKFPISGGRVLVKLLNDILLFKIIYIYKEY